MNRMNQVPFVIVSKKFGSLLQRFYVDFILDRRVSQSFQDFTGRSTSNLLSLLSL